MFLTRYKQIVLILTFGIGLGVLVPALMMQYPFKDMRASLTERIKLMNELDSAHGIDSVPTSNLGETSQDESVTDRMVENAPQQEKLYARVQDGRLSIVQNDPLTGKVVLSGLDIKHWPKDMQALVTRIEFRSLDEVQSFIDSMSEELWIE